mgnify:CR=1 FL=1
MVVVEIFCILVCNIKQFLRIAVDCTAVIDFELDAEMAKALAVGNKVRRVIVLVDNIVVLIPAGHAAGVVVIIPIGTVAVNNPATILAADVVLVEAVVAKRVDIVLDGIFLINPLSAVVADDGQAVCTILAESVAFHLIHIFNYFI